MLEYLPLFLAALLAAIAGTLAGFGSSTLLLPVAMFFMDVHTAIFMVAVFHLVNNFYKVKLFLHNIDRKIFISFGIPSLIFAYFGALLCSIIPVGMLTKFVGVFLVLFVLKTVLFSSKNVNALKISKLVGGAVSGLFSGLIGMGGAIRASFLITYNLSKESYIATGALIAFVIDVTRIPTYWIQFDISQKELRYVLPVLVVLAYCGVKVGKMFLGKVNSLYIKKIVHFALLAVGIKLILF